jgi:hypothetical protein
MNKLLLPLSLFFTLAASANSKASGVSSAVPTMKPATFKTCVSLDRDIKVFFYMNEFERGGAVADVMDEVRTLKCETASYGIYCFDPSDLTGYTRAWFFAENSSAKVMFGRNYQFEGLECK